jgi:predicted ATPase
MLEANMDTDFRLSRVSIRGFRGIPELEVELPANTPVHIIGGNNSGKSTVLDAIALALRGGAFYQFKPSEFDYFHSASGEPVKRFTAAVHFQATDDKLLPAVRAAVGNPIPVHGVQVNGSTDRFGNHSHSRALFGSDGKNIALMQRVPLKGEAKETYGDRNDLAFRKPNARLDDIRADAPEVMHLEPQNLQVQLYRWQSGPLQRLARMLAERFLETEWTFKERQMPDALRHAHGFLRDAVTEFPFWKDDLKPKLQDALSTYLGRQARLDLKPDIQALKDWLAQQLVVAFAADAGGATTPLENMGDGWQSLVRLAVLDVLSQYPDQMRERVVLLFEEPETHLHPHLRRKLRDVLERLAKQGWIVVTATHSPEIISFAQSQKIVRLWRLGDGVHKGEFDASAAPQEVRFQEKLDERGNHEFLFAHRAIFCEGKADVLAVRIGLEKLEVDLDGLGVSVVDNGGVETMPHFAQIASKLGIPWCGMTDEDREPDGTIKPKTKKTRTQLARIMTSADLMPIWKTNLETCLGVSHGQEIEYLRDSVEPRPLTEIESANPDYIAECRKMKDWVGVA